MRLRGFVPLDELVQLDAPTPASPPPAARTVTTAETGGRWASRTSLFGDAED
jgi:hypothetical protein